MNKLITELEKRIKIVKNEKKYAEPIEYKIAVNNLLNSLQEYLIFAKKQLERKEAREKVLQGDIDNLVAMRLTDNNDFISFKIEDWLEFCRKQRIFGEELKKNE